MTNLFYTKSLGFSSMIQSLGPNPSQRNFSFSCIDNASFAQPQSNSLLCSLQHFEVLKEYVNRNAFIELKYIVISLKMPIIIQLRTIYPTSNCFPKDAITSALHVTFSTGLIRQQALCCHGRFPLWPRINTFPYALRLQTWQARQPKKHAQANKQAQGPSL